MTAFDMIVFGNGVGVFPDRLPCTCRRDEDAVGAAFEPCEAGCGTDIAFVTADTLRAAGWLVEDDAIPPGFLERSHHTDEGTRHRQQWDRHTPERCRELRHGPAT